MDDCTGAELDEGALHRQRLRELRKGTAEQGLLRTQTGQLVVVIRIGARLLLLVFCGPLRAHAFGVHGLFLNLHLLLDLADVLHRADVPLHRRLGKGQRNWHHGPSGCLDRVEDGNHDRLRASRLGRRLALRWSGQWRRSWHWHACLCSEAGGARIHLRGVRHTVRATAAACGPRGGGSALLQHLETLHGLIELLLGADGTQLLVKALANSALHSTVRSCKAGRDGLDKEVLHRGFRVLEQAQVLVLRGTLARRGEVLAEVQDAAIWNFRHANAHG
mmetsp:Transcript_23209/g.43630  ORF Transcript_23209/g.43630 Transcript_23209/m.43630 type:complete len:276 (+) Transcript_23209:113-940(+)